MKLLHSPRFVIALTYYSGFKVHQDSPWHMFPSACFAKECGKRVIVVELAGVSQKSSIGLDAVFQAEKFPARVADLNAGLPHVYRDTLTLWREKDKRLEVLAPIMPTPMSPVLCRYHFC